MTRLTLALLLAPHLLGAYSYYQVDNFTSLSSNWSVNGTPTVGTLTILKDANNQEWLHLNADFTSSFATGTVTVYLAKSAARIGDQRVLPPPPVPNIRAIGFVNQNGAQDLKISGSQQGFSHVVFYCETAEINFGNAPLVTP